VAGTVMIGMTYRGLTRRANGSRESSLAQGHGSDVSHAVPRWNYSVNCITVCAGVFGPVIVPHRMTCDDLALVICDDLPPLTRRLARFCSWMLTGKCL
jgi:hypothetical protein